MKRWRQILTRVFLLAGRRLGVDPVSGARIRGRRDLCRLGSGGGAWVIPTHGFSPESVCYCGGCGRDISVDLALRERFACEVFAFDPTPDSAAHVRKTAGHLPGYHFSEIGLWDRPDTLRFHAPKDPAHISHSLVNLQGSTAYLTVPVDRLSNLMRDRGHTRLDLLKIDIEGAEHTVIDSILADRIPIGVLCVEFDELHHPLDAAYRSRVRQTVRALGEAGFDLVCVRGLANYTFRFR